MPETDSVIEAAKLRRTIFRYAAHAQAIQDANPIPESERTVPEAVMEARICPICKFPLQVTFVGDSEVWSCPNIKHHPDKEQS